MNNNRIAFFAIGAVAGLGAGCAAGYCLAKKLYFESKLNEELNALKEYIGCDYTEEELEDYISDEKTVVIDETSPLSEYYSSFSSVKRDYTRPASINDYEGDEVEEDDSLPVGVHHEFLEDDDTPSASYSNLPRPISESDYGVIDGYSCVELGCTDGRTLFDEDGDQMDPSAVDRFVGLDFATYLEDGEDILYMRNDLYETDFKIVFDLDSYDV